jgi:hypothetical protein
MKAWWLGRWGIYTEDGWCVARFWFRWFAKDTLKKAKRLNPLDPDIQGCTVQRVA